MIKNLMIVTGLVFLLYSCTPTHSYQQPTQVEVSECYTKVNDIVRDDWASMNKLQRFQVGMRAISVCEGGN